MSEQLKSNLVKSLRKDCSYADAAKANFHKSAKQFLTRVRKDLNIDADIRSNKGGIAVSGEVTLHSDTLYLQFAQYFGGDICLYRSCKSRKDFTGGQNHFFELQQFDQISYEDFLNKIKMVMS